MRKKHSLSNVITLIIFTLTWMGCGNNTGQSAAEPPVEPSFEPRVATREAVGGIHFDSDISPEEYRLLAKDFHALPSMNFVDDKGEARRLMGLAGFSANDYLTWLEDRVQYILHQNFGIGGSSNADTAADNYGQALYASRKPYLVLFGPHRVSIPGHAPVEVNSPRAGLIRLGPALFRDSDPSILQTESRCRLATFFHEARHSDGNEASGSLGFAHSVCPLDHLYSGKYACDENLNGPYTIGALFLESAMRGCGNNCNAYGDEFMKVQIADFKSRIIRVPGTKELDPTHEGVR